MGTERATGYWPGKPSWRSCHKLDDDDDDDDGIKKSKNRRPVLNRLFQRATFVGWTNCISTRGPIMAYGPTIRIYRVNVGP